MDDIPYGEEWKPGRCLTCGELFVTVVEEWDDGTPYAIVIWESSEVLRRAFEIMEQRFTEHPDRTAKLP